MTDNLLTTDIFLTEDKKKFNVPPHLWSEIKAKYSIDEIRRFIQDTIIAHNVPFPFNDYTPIELKNEFSRFKNEDVYSGLSFIQWTNLRVKIKTDFKYLDKFIFIKRSIVGRACSNAFMEKERMKAYIKYKSISPFDLWFKNENFHKFHFAIKHCDSLDDNNLRASLRMSFGTPSQFSTMVAKTIYTITQANNVLDLSAGWGDRLVGALATESIISYTGIDPNTNLHPNYEKIASEYKHKKKTKFICSPAEDADIEPNQFDVIFTSPPYFDLEIYTNETTQSTSKFKKMDDWLNLFLFKVMERSYHWLKKDGRLILNISDYSNVFFNQRMIDYAESLGFVYEGVIGYELMQRPGDNSIRSNLNNEEFFCEPIFFFRKGNPEELLFSSPNTLF